MKKVRDIKPLKPKYQRTLNRVEGNDSQGETMLSTSLTINEQLLRNVFTECSDIVYRSIDVQSCVNLLVVYIDGLVDAKHLEETILKPLVFQGLPKNQTVTDLVGFLQKQVMPLGDTKIVYTLQDVVQNALKGEVLFLVDGQAQVLVGSIKGWSKRSVDEPQTEQVIRGPREGFIETLRVNTSLIRRKIRSSKLKVESYTVGRYTQTDVAILYIEGVATDLVF
ncbi:spore germination protein [Alicyclobacillus fastidiosus]|uniref:Spore germination protein n=1 Tax=Alicyclobacillus fastidiosus TaxID=392011 RepID=A0ABY6ZDS4_9BACL|nr:spore germination protein [Alicyclobacillus fastidiosus]WAH40286.1 spore germination protein [Alicyclobacillus fastidiosus]GMA61664.1 hypothetical protein GCM10025859_21040 [Alicyclobacillus fastidiosus]